MAKTRPDSRLYALLGPTPRKYGMDKGCVPQLTTVARAIRIIY